jgi:hypothetical protein
MGDQPIGPTKVRLENGMVPKRLASPRVRSDDAPMVISDICPEYRAAAADKPPASAP